jgi:hypothetical protein
MLPMLLPTGVSDIKVENRKGKAQKITEITEFISISCVFVPFCGYFPSPLEFDAPYSQMLFHVTFCKIGRHEELRPTGFAVGTSKEHTALRGFRNGEGQYEGSDFLACIRRPVRVSIPAYGGMVEHITLFPPNPTDADSINVLISGYWSDSCEPGQGVPAVSRAGTTVAIVVPYSITPPNTPCLFSIVPLDFTVPIGRLPVGRYQVTVSLGGSTVSKELNVQGHDDHNDAAPVQSGYLVITPMGAAVSTAPATSALIVFETYGLRTAGSNATQAGDSPPDLTTSAVMFVTTSSRLSRDLGMAIVNPNTGTVNVSMTLRRDDGTQFTTKTIPVLSHQQVSEYVTQLFSSESIPADFTGTLALTSSGGPVSIIGLRFRGANFSTVPVTNLSTVAALPSLASGIGGAGAILLPQFVAGGRWATEIDIANVEANDVTIRLDLFKPDGTPLVTPMNGQIDSSFQNLTMKAGGVLTFAPRNANGDTDF